MGVQYPGSDSKPDAMQAFVQHVISSRYENLSEQAVASTKLFILDSLGVMISGTMAPGVIETLQVLRYWGGRKESTILVFGDKLPALSAAMMNSFMLHNQEFDCVHDQAVLHPFTTVLPVALAIAESTGKITGMATDSASRKGTCLAAEKGQNTGIRGERIPRDRNPRRKSDFVDEE